MLLLLTVFIACKRQAPSGASKPEAEIVRTQARGESRGEAQAKVPTVAVSFAYGSEKKSWLSDAIKRFNESAQKLPSGEVVRIDGQAVGSGAAVEDLVDGTTKPHAWAPASSMYRENLNRAWTARQGAIGGGKDLAQEGKSLALSPVVLAMWKPMAQALGYPDKPIGWAEVLALSKDPEGWSRRGHPEWGAFKFGHTHPAFSNSGTLSVLAEAYAALGKTRGLELSALQSPKLKPYLESIEQAVVHYGKSTGFFADKMLSRGPSFLSAAVLYENLVVESYARPEFQSREFDVVCVYPKEGTFWIDNPFYVLDAPWSTEAHRAGAQLFRDFLLSAEEQTRAMTNFGFRPADPKIALAAPLDAAHGVNPKEPQTLLEVPSAEVVDAALRLWESVKKTVDISFVFDRSGSMAGDPLKLAKQGATDFMQQLNERDRVSVLMFNDKVPEPNAPVPVGDGREQLKQRVADTFAQGGTALYDAIAKAHGALAETAKQNPNRIFAIVVLSDGKDEHSKLGLGQLKERLKLPVEATEPPIRLFTIAYGAGADTRILEDLAEAAGGATFKGDVTSIRQVYRDLAAFF
ncbi:MAG: extracellular solute-binding protein [Myxococcota bacterium]